MFMLVDLSACTVSFDKLKAALSDKGDEIGLKVTIQREDIFNAMHKI